MKRLWLMLFFLFIAYFAFSQDLLPGITDYIQLESVEMEMLQKGEELAHFHNQNPAPDLLPQSIYTQKVLNILKELEPNMAIEGLYFIPHKSPDSADMLNVLNTLCSVSTLQGIEYYSHSRETMRLLFEESYALDNFSDRNIKEDPQYDSLPFLVEMNIFQKDLSFGSNDSTLKIWSDPQGIFLEQENQTPMKYDGIIKVINPKKFKTILLVLPCDEGWLYYGIMAADTFNIRALINRANTSLYNRMKAFYNWFVEEYSKA